MRRAEKADLESGLQAVSGDVRQRLGLTWEMSDTLQLGLSCSIHSFLSNNFDFILSAFFIPACVLSLTSSFSGIL